MKRYLFILLFFAATFSVQAQSQNVYRLNQALELPAGFGTTVRLEIPATLLSLWTLGGSFQVTNTGASTDAFTVTVYGTSDPDLAQTPVSNWQVIKTVTTGNIAAGATSYQHFRAANEMFYLGHTRLMIVGFGNGNQPATFDFNLVLKKR